MTSGWDQLGTAKTFARAGDTLPPDLKVDDYVNDGIAVTEYLKTHLQKDKVIVLGWSWGSMVGIEMVRARPDLFSAYVGTGQEVNQPRGEKIVYQSVLAEARRRGAKQAVEELEAIGPPPYGTSSEVRIQRVWAMRFEGTDLEFFLSLILLAPRYSLGDELSWVRGVLASGDVLVGSDMKGPMTQVDFAAESLTFEVPIFVIHGTEDYWVPAELARAWVESLSAPTKEFIPMEGAAHFALMLHADEFVKIMNERLRPLTSASD